MPLGNPFMRHLNPTEKRGQKLTTPAQRSSLAFKFFIIGICLVLLASAVFLLAFLVRPDLTPYGMTWREAQTYALLVAFAGLIIASTSAKIIRLDTRALSMVKLSAILFNREYLSPRAGDAVRKAVLSTLSRLDDSWSLTSELRISGEEVIDLVLTGPAGVYAIQLYKSGDPHSRRFVDPAPGLARAAQTLGAEIQYEVTPILAFISKSKTYPNTHPSVKTFNMMEMLAWVEARPPKLTPIDRQRIESRLRSISKNFNEINS
jgi:hypothetical protein